MANHMMINEVDGTHSLSFSCGELPADEAIAATGHEPNGYFWEGIAMYLAPDVVEQLELDAESGMFAAYGDLTLIERLQELIEPYLSDGKRTGALISAAEAEGFEFDD